MLTRGVMLADGDARVLVTRSDLAVGLFARDLRIACPAADAGEGAVHPHGARPVHQTRRNPFD